ncbi:MAG: hypothetical protein NC299_10280 [Lachnospiraceae bacterium]|nr:hypothetical protein [Ruminococcus sp.]MCM1275734.1 hypothetical protein [Lachnospiraceae bacterium]
MSDTTISNVEFTQKFTNEFGCVCNEIVFTAANGNKLCLTLFDIKPLNADNIDKGYYEYAEGTLSGLPGGFPVIYGIMYTEAAAEKCDIERKLR